MRPPAPFAIWRFGDGRASFIGRAGTMDSARAWLRQLRGRDGSGYFIVVDDRLEG